MATVTVELVVGLAPLVVALAPLVVGLAPLVVALAPLVVGLAPLVVVFPAPFAFSSSFFLFCASRTNFLRCSSVAEAGCNWKTYTCL